MATFEKKTRATWQFKIWSTQGLFSSTLFHFIHLIPICILNNSLKLVFLTQLHIEYKTNFTNVSRILANEVGIIYNYKYHSYWTFVVNKNYVLSFSFHEKNRCHWHNWLKKENKILTTITINNTTDLFSVKCAWLICLLFQMTFKLSTDWPLFY